MAKQVQLKQNGVEIYPQTITQAIADVTKGKLLSNIITELETEALGWTIEPTTSGSTLQYTLWKQVAKADGSGYDKVSASTFNIAQDVYLDSVVLVKNEGEVPAGHTAPGNDFPYLLMIFNTESGKQDTWVSVKDLMEIYEADGKAITIETDGATDEGIITFNVSEDAGNILEVKNDGAFVSIGAQGDTYVSATLSGDSKTVVVAADVAAAFSGVTGSETASGQLADAAQVKKYIDDKTTDLAVTAESKSPEYITATVDALTDNKHVIVSAVTGSFTGTASALTGSEGIADAAEAASAVKAYVDGRVLAEKERVDALTAGQSGSTDYIEVQVSTLGGNVNGVSVSNQVATDFSTVTSTDKKLADAYAIKSYVDSKTGDLDSTVSGETAEGYIDVTIVQTDGALASVTINNDIQQVATAGTNAKGLAEASDVKSYVDGEIEDLAISASGDTYVNAAVDASDNKKINVSANLASVTYADSALTIGATEGVVNAAGATAIKNYIDAKVGDEATARTNAINALNADVSAKTTDEFITVQVVEQSGVVTSVAISDTVQTISTADSAHTGLLEASDAKAYIDGKVSASTIVASDDITPTATAQGTSLAINFEPDGVESGSTLSVKSGDVFAWGVTAEIKGDAPEFTWPS